MRTKFAKTEGWRYFTEECHDIEMFNATLCIGIVLTPKTNEFVEMMGAQNGPITRQIIKVIHDDSNKQVYDLEKGKWGLSDTICGDRAGDNSHQKGAKNVERNEIRVG